MEGRRFEARAWCREIESRRSAKIVDASFIERIERTVEPMELDADDDDQGQPWILAKIFGCLGWLGIFWKWIR